MAMTFHGVNRPMTPHTGALRFDENREIMEIFDGTNWVQVASERDPWLSNDLLTVLDWADAKIQTLGQEDYADSPTILDALEAFSIATEQLQILLRLAKKEA